MFERECKLYAFNQGYLRQLVADIEDGKLAFAPAPGVNTPLWLLGHLSISTDFALRLLGQPTACPPEWHRGFGPGSKPSELPDPRPNKETLMKAIGAGHRSVTTAALAATEGQVAGLHNVDIGPLKRALPTVAELLAHIMTTHEATHLGQLSVWRRLMGLPSLM